MPSIAKSVAADLSMYKPEQTPLPIVNELGSQNNLPTIRCPLPPFNVTPDTLRQFDNKGQTPQVRLIPLPVTANTTVNQTTNTTVTGGSSSSSSAGTTLKAATVTYTPGVIAGGSQVLGAITMAKSFQLLNLVSNTACDIRLYASAVVQAQDASRLTDQPVPLELTSGIITNVVFDTSPFQWNWQNRAGASPTAVTTMYITVVNTSSSGAISPTINISYLPLES